MERIGTRVLCALRWAQIYKKQNYNVFIYIYIYDLASGFPAKTKYINNHSPVTSVSLFFFKMRRSEYFGNLVCSFTSDEITQSL
jgi:hypothetical protein